MFFRIQRPLVGSAAGRRSAQSRDYRGSDPGSQSKQSEHGGFAHDDTNVMLVVSNPSIQPMAIHSFVETMQVAPTILSILGLDPNALQAVQIEGTPVLPSLTFKN